MIREIWNGEIKKMVLWWIRTLLLVSITAYLLVRYVVQRVDVYGDSMSPVLEAGDVLLVEKLTPRLGELKRFDLVVFRYQYRDNLYYIKRIVGLPGETIQIVDGGILIDGSVLEEDFGTEPIEKGRRSLLSWERMSILCWATTGTTVQTAGIRISGI